MPRPNASGIPLTRDRVVDRAIDLVDRDGIGALNMRRLASELEVGTMSLYNHVADKDQLLDAMAERITGRVRVPRATTWREVVTKWATATRRLYLTHPKLVPVVFAPRRSNRGTELPKLAEALAATGLGGPDAVIVLRVVVRFVAGSVLVDSLPRSGGRGRISRTAADRVFAVGLDALLTGIQPSLGDAPD